MLPQTTTAAAALPIFLLLLSSSLPEPASAAPFNNAEDARAKMETIVSSYATELESMYADMTSEEKTQCDLNTYVESCDPNSDPAYASKWTAATVGGGFVPPRFNNPTTQTCTRFDMDEGNRFLSTPRTGRTNTCSGGGCKDPADTIDCTYDQGDSLYDTKCKCIYNVVTRDFQMHVDSIKKYNYLQNTGCISASDTTKCTVNPDEYGINFPADVGLTNSRMCAEIVASSKLIPKFKQNAEDYDDLQWTFSGMQETGLYRNWPLIYQCRTEAQCSGCSDPRFRSWYASAASGPKDVVMILDCSGSMSKKGRFGLMKKAAKWVANTLTKYDSATVVQFSSDAQAMDWGSGDTKLHRMDDVGRARMKEYIDTLAPFGQTNMPAAFTKAFDVLDDTLQGGGGSGCGNTQTVILFLTDGENSADTDPIEVVTRRNNENYKARVFTYSLGADTGGSNRMMQRLACDSSGVWAKVEDGGNLEKVMASYFMYLSAGIAQATTVRWSDWFEDGQGLGQIMGACAPVYDRAASDETGVSIMFGVICVSIHKDTWEGYSDHVSVKAAIETADAQCPVSTLTQDQMEVVRGRSESSQSCSGAASDGGGGVGAVIGGVIGGIIAVVVIGYAASKCCRKTGGEGQKPRPAQTRPAPAQPVYAQQPQQRMVVAPATAHQPTAAGVVVAPPAYHVNV